MDLLTDEQKSAFFYIDQKQNIFITSRGAGCGKTFLLKQVIQRYKTIRNIAVTASTGVAAVMLKGQTLHSWAGIGLGKKPVEELIREIKRNKRALSRWKKVEMLIIDEISLISPVLFDKLEYIARKLRKTENVFGGICVIVSGDWLQLPTVDSNKYAFESRSWTETIQQIVYLTEIKRQDNKDFQEILNSIRLGHITKKAKRLLRSRLNVKLENKYGIKPTNLYALNCNVDLINKMKIQQEIQQNKCEKKSYKITWEPKKELYKSYEKYLKLCNAPDKLDLCIGAQVMLLWNKNQFKNMVNGSRGVITGFTKTSDLPIVKFLDGTEEIIEHHQWNIEINSTKIGTFSQIPLKLAYATTIHKSQGSSLDYVSINLANIFVVSQAYVGLSRARNLEGLSIQNLNFKKFGVNRRALKFYLDLEQKRTQKLENAKKFDS